MYKDTTPRCYRFHSFFCGFIGFIVEKYFTIIGSSIIFPCKLLVKADLPLS